MGGEIVSIEVEGQSATAGELWIGHFFTIMCNFAEWDLISGENLTDFDCECWLPGVVLRPILLHMGDIGFLIEPDAEDQSSKCKRQIHLHTY